METTVLKKRIAELRLRIARAENSEGTPKNSKSAIRNAKFSRVIMVGALGSLALTNIVAGQSNVPRQRPRRASICGNPKLACKTTVTFEPHDLPFRVPKDAVIIDTVPFYAVILQSVAAGESCEVFISENDRLAAQALFPDHKVFTSRCTDPDTLFYLDIEGRKITNISETQRIMAAYAGTSLVEAKRFLEKVKATGKFPGANLRRMRTGFNGT